MPQGDHRQPEFDALIIDAVRTPVGRYSGALREVRPDDLAAHVIRELIRRTRIDPNRGGAAGVPGSVGTMRGVNSAAVESSASTTLGIVVTGPTLAGACAWLGAIAGAGAVVDCAGVASACCDSGG